MNSFPGSPRLLKGGIVLLDLATSQPPRIIALQYNPDTLTRTLQVKGAGAEGGDRSEALRLKGPPVETIKLEAEIDLIDQTSVAELDPPETSVGIFPQLAALEMIVYPASTHLQASNEQSRQGKLEIAAEEAPLTLFVWSKNRILPVRLTEFSITEEAFDTLLNPIRAKVSLGMRVLSTDDLGFAHKGGSMFMTYLQNKELFAQSVSGDFNMLGITGIP